jgi:dTDP-4-dehydrorhamnose 3,5-epimerase
MHWQVPPFSECKLVKCTRGAIFDVIIDLRPWSDTFKAWHGTELTELNYRMLLVPEGFAHGFLTLEEDTEVQYQVSQFYAPEFERGLKFDDPEFNIEWPLPVSTISRKDASWAPVSEVTWREMLGAASGGAR